MSHPFSEPAGFKERCPYCNTVMEPTVYGYVLDGDPYDERVECSACGKTLRRDPMMASEAGCAITSVLLVVVFVVLALAR